MKYFEVEITNWEEHNPQEKTKGKESQWFRLSGKLARSSKFLELSPGAKHAWLWLLCERCLSGQVVLRVHTGRFSREVHVKTGRVPAVLRELESHKWLRIVNAPSSRTRAVQTDRQTDRQTDMAEGPAKSLKAKPEKATPPQTAVAAATHPAKQGELLPTEKGTPTSRCVAHYCELFKARYGTNPVTRGKEAGILAGLLKAMSETEVKRLLNAYFAMPDAWAVKKRHELGIFSFNIQEVKVFADSGKFMTMTDVRDKDREVQGRVEQREQWEGMDEERKKRFMANFDDGKPKAIEGGK